MYYFYHAQMRRTNNKERNMEKGENKGVVIVSDDRVNKTNISSKTDINGMNEINELLWELFVEESRMAQRKLVEALLNEDKNPSVALELKSDYLILQKHAEIIIRQLISNGFVPELSVDNKKVLELYKRILDLSTQNGLKDMQDLFRRLLIGRENIMRE